MFYLITAAFLAFFSAFYLMIGYTVGVWATLYGAAVVPLLLFVFRETGSFRHATIVFDLNAIVMFSILIYGSGGINSCILPWLAIIPATGFAFAGWHRGLLMTLVGLGVILTFYIVNAIGHPAPELYDQRHAGILHLVVMLGLMAYCFMIFMFYQTSRERTIALLDNLNADLSERKRQVEDQREALAASNARIAQANNHLEGLVASRTAKLARAKKELDTFLYEAAHALRRPVARIMGLSSILRQETMDSPTAQTMHDHLDTSSRLLDRILHKLILVSELEQRQSEVRAVDVGEWMEALIERHREAITSHGAAVDLRVEGAGLLETDGYLLGMVMDALLENAIHYTQKTGRQPEIHLATRREGCDMLLTVHDNGLGIVPVAISRLGEMFYRATEKVQGGGLGLYVAQKATELLGGQLHYESEVGQWTLVELRIPAAAAVAVPVMA